MEEKISVNCIYKPINDHNVVAVSLVEHIFCLVLFFLWIDDGLKLLIWSGDGGFTRRCICVLDSLVNRMDSCKHPKILWNLTMAQAHESCPANEPMIEASREHLPVALNHTKFEHNSGKITDHGLILSPVSHHPPHDRPPISCTPVKLKKQINSWNLCLNWWHKSKKLTRNACLSPPLSAIFSLCVSFPFIYRPNSFTLYREYWSMMHCARVRNAVIVELFHHCFILPSLSNWRPN